MIAFHKGSPTLWDFCWGWHTDIQTSSECHSCHYWPGEHSVSWTWEPQYKIFSQDMRLVDWIMTPQKNIHIFIPGNCECDLAWQKICRFSLGFWDGEIILDYPDEPYDAATVSLKGQFYTDTRGRGSGTAEAEIHVMPPQAEECWSWRSWGADSP